MRTAVLVTLGLFGPVALFSASASAAPLARERATAPTPPTAPASLPPSYVVKTGDSLGGIARRLQVVLQDLLDANDLTITSVIHPGDVLVVPGAVPAPPPAPLKYVVVANDSIFGVAKKLGVAVPALLAANSLTLTSTLIIGRSLVVPDGGHLPVVALAAPTTTVPAAPPTTNAPPAPAAGSTRYTVLNGDYLAGIARKNGVTLPALLAANQITASSVIVPGQVLTVPPATLPIPGATTTTSAAPGASPIDTVITFLRAQVGKPYVFNAAGPDAFDCSGLVTAAYDLIGISLPHQSLLQSTKGIAVDWRTQDLQPGDLVFQFSSATPNVIGHVGIVIDATHWIQAAGTGIPVRIGPIPADDKIQSVRRIVQP